MLVRERDGTANGLTRRIFWDIGKAGFSIIGRAKYDGRKSVGDRALP